MVQSYGDQQQFYPGHPGYGPHQENRSPYDDDRSAQHGTLGGAQGRDGGD